MKTNAVKVVVAALAAVVILIGNPLTSKANGGGDNSKKVSPAEAQVSVSYEGTSDNQIVFKVEFENPTAQKFWLIIKNDNGDIVYHHQFSDTKFAKNVCFENTDTEIQPTFVIRTSDNVDVVRQFSVNKTITESTVVTSL
jgi:hypothetical protein